MTEVKLLIAVLIGIAVGEVAVRIYLKWLERQSKR